MDPAFESLIQSMCHPDSQQRESINDLLNHGFFSSPTADSSDTITNAIHQIKSLPSARIGTPTIPSPLMQMASGLSRYQTGVLNRFTKKIDYQEISFLGKVLALSLLIFRAASERSLRRETS
jgi:serine/threonine protein kinase